MRAFPGYKHDDYLDLPDGAAQWLLRIHTAVEKHADKPKPEQPSIK